MGDLSEHFNASEFRCHDHQYPLPADFPETISDTVDFLERLRGFMNFYLAQKNGGRWMDLGINITSGHRAFEYDKKIKEEQRGEKLPADWKSTSRHCYGVAADVTPVGGYAYFSYKDFYKMTTMVDRSFSERPYRLGLYTKSSFVHVDCGYGHGGRRWGK